MTDYTYKAKYHGILEPEILCREIETAIKKKKTDLEVNRQLRMPYPTKQSKYAKK